MGVYWLRFLRKDGGELGSGLVVPRVIGSHSKFRLGGVPGGPKGTNYSDLGNAKVGLEER